MGLLTILKNFLLPKRWRKKPTKQSNPQPLEQNNKDIDEPIGKIHHEAYYNMLKDRPGFNLNKPDFKNPPPTDEQIKEAMKRLDSIVDRMQNEFMKNRTLVDIKPTTTSIVQVTSDYDKILDIINSMPARLKSQALDMLSSPTQEHAVFMSVLDENKERNYAILLNHLGDEEMEPGLLFMSSVDQDAVCAMLAEISNVTYEKAKAGFSGPGENS
jgi:hypothetical protein